MKSEMSFFEKTFWKSSFLIKDPTHVIRNIQSFDCHVFCKQKLTHCKTKMAFSFPFFFMVLCVSFNLWSWVYLLMVYDEVTFCKFQGKQKAQVKTWGFIRKDCFLFFLATILSAYIITSSLIYEATTLMKNSSSFEIAIYRFSLLTWLKRAFKST